MLRELKHKLHRALSLATYRPLHFPFLSFRSTSPRFGATPLSLTPTEIAQDNNHG